MATAAPPRDRRPPRRAPPQATYISPTTGERIKRVFTLRNASRRNDAAGDETQPLLPRNQEHQSGKSSWTEKAKQQIRTSGQDAWKFSKSSVGQGILKCSLAYALGSLATFVPAISSLIGKADSKHIVCSVTVWFSPSRTVGSMYEGVVLALIGFCYAAFIAVTSMAISMFFGQRDLLQVGHVIVLVFFCGGGLGFVAWTKQFFNHPLVNVACSLASLACVSTLVKEGTVQAGAFSEDRVKQILIMVIMGIFVTTLVNMVVLPVRARRRLHKDLVKDTELLSELLVNITRAFLVGEEDILTEGKQIAKDHQGTLNSMQKNLVEAQREHYLMGSERQYHIEAKLVRCLGRLSQNLGGLRSAAYTQFAILRKAVTQSEAQRAQFPWSNGTTSPVEIIKSRNGSISRINMLDVINEDSEESEERVPASWDGASTPARSKSRTSLHNVPWKSQSGTSTPNNDILAPADMFVTFIDQLGPPAKSLVFTLQKMLDELQFGRNGTVAFDERFSANLRSAIDLYTESRKEALATLYRSKPLNGPRPMEVLADLEEVAASCGHFSFSLLDLAEGAMTYLDLLEELHAEIERSPKRRTWYWLMFWRRSDETPEEHPRIFGTFQAQTEVDPGSNIPEPIKRVDMFADGPARFANERPWTLAIYKSMSIFRRDDVRFAIKVGVGAALYALPAYLPETRPFFTHWRGEWGLISYMVVCSMTIGASNTTGIERIGGTLIGAIAAIFAWLISNNDGEANPWVLCFLGWLMSVWCFYLINAKGKGPMGRFILLTYNLSALYAYSLSVRDDEDDDDEGGVDPAIWEIVIHRVVAVIVGCLWAIVITRFIWPISARRKLRDGLCILWLRMCLIWKRDPLAVYLLGEPKSSYMDIREGAELQSFLTYLDSLRKAAASEFELSGPFPDKITGRIVERTRAMLDAFHAMNVVMSKNAEATPGEAALLLFTRGERFALSARISHLFSVLASSLKLEYPLNDVLPDIESRRDALLARIFEFRRTNAEVAEQEYELLYAYVLVTGQLADDLKAVIQDIETLFGTLNEENLKLQ